MEFEVFNRLPKEKQHKLVAKEGVMLRERRTPNFIIFLYGLEGFYVELFFHRNSGTFATIKSFDNMDELSPYLEEIDVSQLIQQ